MSPLLSIGVNLTGTGSANQRLAALEQAVADLDGAVKALAQALIEAGVPTGATNALTTATDAVGLPPPPPLPTTVSK